MKKLIVVRHGKSSWKNADLADHDRPLKKRGYNDAQLVIKAFRTYFQHPVKMISSSAKRALTTAEMFKEGLEVNDDNFEVLADLYTFQVLELLEVIKNQPDEDNKLMVFGHNPAMTQLVNFLGDEVIENLPTTGLVVIDFEVESWKSISNGKTLVKLFPKMFK
ncbi:SixA phosphatase family protein [Mesonia aestuariivivens]|uniref:Histidine phosphatase family protein n=1 Tax=Mesonia aestuariivivens TaxID=2796128 RepID=A0ABS6VYF0_9FLAO|nr:histidine phosphatase family protein [Mesonia aestuariivivens]MBW2960624.1 histidine phosphatase family protein [Mesonia aestuariivivens]